MLAVLQYYPALLIFEFNPIERCCTTCNHDILLLVSNKDANYSDNLIIKFKHIQNLFLCFLVESVNIN